MTFLRRLLDVLRAMLVVLDVVACFLGLTALYLAGRPKRPNGTQMISACVGRAALNGDRWAIRAAEVIDWLFSPWGPNHCRSQATLYAGYAD